MTTPDYGLGSLRRKIMFFQNLLILLVILILIHPLYRWIKRRKADQLAREIFNTEMARIEGLPKLSTRWLMRVPYSVAKNHNYTKRFYGTRYNRMLIFDERGDAWVGLVIPEVLESLKAGEYISGNYYIPFRGGGEAFDGEAVTIDGQRINIYPKWMAPGVNIPDWNLWARIERNFSDRSRQWNYQSGLGEMNEHMDEFRKKRAELNRLAVVKIKV